MRLDVVTLFPGLFEPLREHGVVGRALRTGVASLHLWQLRDFATDKHRSVDDRPYGGGPGMVLMAGPVVSAVQAARAAGPQPGTVIYLSPQGRRLDQRSAAELARRPHLVLLCGRYEGVDERALDTVVDEEWSIGDYVLSGGELPALVLIDALVRLLPGALGDAESAAQDSFSDGLLDCPHYTRPEIFEGRHVPPVLMSGDHGRVARWRLAQSLTRTRQRRPDLLVGQELSADQRRVLAEFEVPADAGRTQ